MTVNRSTKIPTEGEVMPSAASFRSHLAAIHHHSYYVFMTAVVGIGLVTKKAPLLHQLADLISLRTPQAFGRERNALPTLCN
jgi:hypothetical protein